MHWATVDDIQLCVSIVDNEKNHSY